MLDFTLHPYTGPTDLQAMLALLPRIRPAERITEYPSPVDLQEALNIPAVQANTRLWYDTSDELVGFAFVDTYHNLVSEFTPQIEVANILPQMIAWGVTCIQRAMADGRIPYTPGERITLDASCREEDKERMAVLEKHGFEALELRSLHLVRSLKDPLPAPQLPEGFILRPIAGDHEVPYAVGLHQAAFDSDHLTIEERLAWMQVPEYDPTLDLFVIAPDGTWAASCMCSISQEENALTGQQIGYTDPIATHPAFRRRGLARALILTGCHLLQQRGMEMAVLGTSTQNLPMYHLAKSLGFQVESTKLWFEKPVTP
ncbi:MAG: GNAT family N-acetyltransferase [Anaerolineae bacterium]|nr:GNAT family N-acetyltransferase [Anaerolineae bacterium]